MLKTFWHCDKKFLVGPTFFQNINYSITKSLKIKSNYQISVNVVSNANIRRLNKTWRKIDKPTDVLAFSFIEDKKFITGKENWLGEIIISHQKAKEQAQILNIPIKSEIARLYVHGVLHLLGHDHQNKNQTEKMKKIENKILINANYKL